MSQPLVYVDTSRVRKGAVIELKSAIKELAEFVEENEPQLLSYSVYLSDDGSEMTVVQAHADPASLDYHMEVAGPRFGRFVDLVTLSSIHIYGEPSTDALEQLREKMRLLGSGEVVVHPPHVGFSRSAAPILPADPGRKGTMDEQATKPMWSRHCVKPRLPEWAEYGAGDRAKQLSWTTARRWLEDARYYWIATVRGDGTPHTVPVWAVWLEDRLVFSMSPQTLTARNLERSSHAVAHPESASEAVIVKGLVRQPSPKSLFEAVDAYEAKYAWRLDPEDDGMPFYELVPRRVLAWLAEDIRGSSACWDF